MRVGLGLGSNVGDRLANLRAARAKIVDLPDVTGPLRSSSIYETEPVDCEPGAAKFLNAVIEIDYAAGPPSLLELLREIEQSLGRPADRPRSVSRSIDIDILYFEDRQVETDQLRLPHPRLHLRRFVLEPLAEIRPDLVLPSRESTVAEMLANLDDTAEVVRFPDGW